MRGTSATGAQDVGEQGGFRSPAYNGKQGVFVYMADGSVRFLAKGISPEVFKALCTKAGNDNAVVGELDKIAPRVEAPGAKAAAKPAPKEPPKADAKPDKPPDAKPDPPKPADKPPEKPKADK